MRRNVALAAEVAQLRTAHASLHAEVVALREQSGSSALTKRRFESLEVRRRKELIAAEAAGHDGSTAPGKSGLSVRPIQATLAGRSTGDAVQARARSQPPRRPPRARAPSPSSGRAPDSPPRRKPQPPTRPRLSGQGSEASGSDALASGTDALASGSDAPASALARGDGQVVPMHGGSSFRSRSVPRSRETSWR